MLITTKERMIIVCFGDVLDSRGTLTFDLPKFPGRDQRPRDFDRKATYSVMQPCLVSSRMYVPVRVEQLVSNVDWDVHTAANKAAVDLLTFLHVRFSAVKIGHVLAGSRSQFAVQEIIGGGASCVVARCKNTRTKETVAAKIFPAELHSSVGQSEVRRCAFVLLPESGHAHLPAAAALSLLRRLACSEAFIPARA